MNNQHGAGGCLSRRGAARGDVPCGADREQGAREMGMDPAEFRRRNFVTSFPHQTPVIMCYDAGDYAPPRSIRRLSLPIMPDSPRARRRPNAAESCAASAYPIISRPAASPRRRRGLARGGRRLWESAEVRVNPTGNVEVLTGSHSHGQGMKPPSPNGVARLGIPIDQVSVIHGDTDKVQFGMGTYGSRSGVAVGVCRPS